MLFTETSLHPVVLHSRACPTFHREPGLLHVFVQPPLDKIHRRRISERPLSLLVHVSVSVFCCGLVAFSLAAWGTGKGEIRDAIRAAV
jgi:hypothetical protein